MVEALHHSAAPHQGSAHRGADEEQRCELTFLLRLIQLNILLSAVSPCLLSLQLSRNGIFLCIISHVTCTATCCVLGGDPAAEIEAGEGGERAKRVEAEHRSIGEQGGSRHLRQRTLGKCCSTLEAQLHSFSRRFDFLVCA